MNTMQKIKTAFERNAQALALRPSLGRKSAVTRIHWRDDLTCEIEEGDWRLLASMGTKHGGSNAGPNPGILARGALGACLVVVYAMWAAKLQVPITALDIELHAGHDACGEYAVADVRPGYDEIRYRVRISSPAPEADVLRVLDLADAHSSLRDLFASGTELIREVEFQNNGVQENGS